MHFLIEGLFLFYIMVYSFEAFWRKGFCSKVYHGNSDCLVWNFLCANGRCISRELFRNQRDDCGDNSDEIENNDYDHECHGSLSRCRTSDRSYKCIPYLWLCDGIYDCLDDEDEQYCKITALEDLSERCGPKIRVQYSLWFGNDKDLERCLALRVPANMSFYSTMELAAEVDTRYRFEYVMKNGKPYVNAISGIKDNPEKNKFWFLYTLVGESPVSTQESPVDIVPKDQQHFVMWYRSGLWLE